MASLPLLSPLPGVHQSFIVVINLSSVYYLTHCTMIELGRELAYQLAEQFRALGSSLHLRCTVVVGGMDMLTQTQTLTLRPHVVISTPGRIKVLLDDSPDVPPVFSNTKVVTLTFQPSLSILVFCKLIVV